MYNYLAKSIVFFLFFFLVGCDPNAKLTFGETGLPKNCRAIIQANLDGWHSGEYSAEEALGSIERNCGKDGYSWGK